MNLVLLNESDFINSDHVCLKDNRLIHLKTILKVQPGHQVCVGIRNGMIGQARVEKVLSNEIILKVNCGTPPPEPAPVILIVALPRPNAVKRVVFHATTLGVKTIYFLNFSRVEKSLWSSSALRPDEIERQITLGLEQAKDTLMPEVLLRKRFKPFVEDELPALLNNRFGILAEPQASDPIYNGAGLQNVLIIGPEGGVVPFEREKLLECGFKEGHLGCRILRTEAAVISAVSQLSLRAIHR